MDYDLFCELANEATGKVQQFNLFHRGESLLHPKIPDMIGYTERRGIRTRINTNGTLLNPDLGRELIDSGLDMLSLSFDGYDREMYEANRINADFEKVLGNILKFLTIKKNLKSAKPFVTIELMELSSYDKEIIKQKRQNFLQKFEGLPLDKFVIRHPHNWGGLVEAKDGDKQEVQKRIPCPLLWHALIVFWNGKALPCPQDFFGQLELGDVNEQTLMEIWNGEKLKELRRAMSDPSSLDRHPCLECDRITRATIAGVPKDYLGRFLSENVFGNGWISKILPH